MDDLISRAAAIDVINTWGRQKNVEARMGLLYRDLYAIPAVDAAPMVHGRWTEKETSENTIDEWQSAKCTNCGKYHTTPYLYYFSDYKFCPNCGAKMDGERRESE